MVLVEVFTRGCVVEVYYLDDQAVAFLWTLHFILPDPMHYFVDLAPWSQRTALSSFAMAPGLSSTLVSHDDSAKLRVASRQHMLSRTTSLKAARSHDVFLLRGSSHGD